VQSQAGTVEWLKGDVSFGETEVVQHQRGWMPTWRLDRVAAGSALVFGGGDRRVMSQSGGALLGLIKQVNRGPLSTLPAADLRPTALAQLGFGSFCLDAASLQLTLSRTPLILPVGKVDALPLVDPRLYGDGVEHVCCRVDGDTISIDGKPRASSRPILCVFDSGLTGCVLSQSLVDELGLHTAGKLGTAASAVRTAVSALELGLRTEQGQRVVLGSSVAHSPLFYVQALPLGWFVDTVHGPHVVALGQCILGRGTLTVDGAQRRALWAV